jgi:hypothetical protein
MNFPLKSWDGDYDKELRITCYLIGALGIDLCVGLFVYAIVM